jgi:hypothetical protein
LARDGFGEIDTSKITVVGNARVDEVKKPFAFAKGVIGKIYRESPKARYTDFDAPSVSVEKLAIADRTLTAKVKTALKTTKVEMHINGNLIATFTEGFDQLKYPLNGEMSEGPHEIAFYAYDRFLNCGYATTQFRQSAL